MIEELIKMFSDEKNVDISIRPKLTEIAIFNIDRTHADMIFYDIEKLAKEHDLITDTSESITPLFTNLYYDNGTYNGVDGFLHGIFIYQNGVCIASVDIYFH